MTLVVLVISYLVGPVPASIVSLSASFHFNPILLLSHPLVLGILYIPNHTNSTSSHLHQPHHHSSTLPHSPWLPTT